MRLSWPWWRRRTPGRHELGAAVTAIPSGVGPLVGSMAPQAAALASSTTPPITGLLVYAAPTTAAAPATPTTPAAPGTDLGRSAGPMVSLGFRDGSTATLDPASRQALALQQLANSLTATD